MEGIRGRENARKIFEKKREESVQRNARSHSKGRSAKGIG
jgi:hypothetical protein